jgi:uncharacterized LabA/DUF88 family protein
MRSASKSPRPGFSSELQSSGITLVNCPRKDVRDKMILGEDFFLCRKTSIKWLFLLRIPVDMLAHAMDTPPSTIVLITGDQADLSYALSILKRRWYRTILIAPLNADSTTLRSQASLCFDWDNIVLNSSTNPGPSASPKRTARCMRING